MQKYEQNLKSLAEYPEEKRKQIAHSGGVASEKAHKLKVDLHDLILNKLFEQDLNDGINLDWGVDYGKIHLQKLVDRLFNEAEKGNMQAWDRIFYYAGVIRVDNSLIDKSLNGSENE